MKLSFLIIKKLPFLLICLIIFNSCSSDNDLNESNINSLKMIKRDHYNNLTHELDSKIVAVYENGRQVSDSTFNLQGEVQFYRHFEYLNGKYSSFQVYWNNELFREHKVFYDTQDRIFKTVNIDYELNSNITRNFTFNFDNTISSEINENGTITNVIFYINENDIIYKKESLEQNSEVIFDDNFNIISYELNNTPQVGQPNTTTISLSHDNINFPPDNYFSMNYRYGSYRHNKNLSSGNLGLLNNWYGNKHIIKTIQTYNSSPFITSEYNYTFNEDNLPLTKTTYENGNLRYEDEYIYNE